MAAFFVVFLLDLIDDLFRIREYVKMVKYRLNQLIEFGDNIHQISVPIGFSLANDIFSLIFSNIQRQAIEPLELNRYVRTMLTEFNLWRF